MDNNQVTNNQVDNNQVNNFQTDNNQVPLTSSSEEKKNVPKNFPVGTIFLILILAGIVAAIYFNKDSLSNKKADEPAQTVTEQESKEEDKKEEQQTGEKEITETAKINTLNEKVKALSNYKADLVSPAPELFKNISNKDMTDGEKLQTVLMYLDTAGKFTFGVPSKYPNLTGEIIKKDWDITSTEEAVELYLDEDEEEGYHLIKASEVNEFYKKLFGSEPSTTVVTNTYPNYYYEKAYDIYLRVARGGGTCGTEFASYNYKYTEDENNAYVYTTVAYSSCETDVCKDKDLKHEVAEFETDEDDTIIEEFDEKFVKKIMDKLDKYRVVFKKDGSNYIFDKVEFVEN